MTVASSVSDLTIALAGQPNVGKSTIFNYLTGLNQHVGNWPGKTVEQKAGIVDHNHVKIRIVDLPGAYGLTASSEEERIARDFIIKEQPDAVILVVNATAIERNLYLLTELLDLQVPIVLAMNMMDVARSQGIEIMPVVLAARLGLPIVPITAVENEGIDELLSVAIAQAKETRADVAHPELRKSIQRAQLKISGLLGRLVPEPYKADWIALKLLEDDSEVYGLVRSWVPPKFSRELERILGDHRDAVLDIVGDRYEWIGKIVRTVVDHGSGRRANLTERVDAVVLHPIGGMIILFCVLAVTFLATFSIAWPIQNFLETGVIVPLKAWASVTLAGFSPPFAHFITDGVLGGVGLVVTFVPLLLVFYAIFGILEDTGYLARVAYLTDRFMHRLGLHGKSFLPFCLGFGCNVPAIMGARVIESPRGRLLTILLTPLVPCSARFAVLAFLAPIFFGPYALMASLGLVFVNLAVLASLGVLLSYTLFKDEKLAFIMELPLYHRPNLRSIGLFMWNHTKSCLHRASTMILIVATLVWALGYFPAGDLETSYLAGTGRLLTPLGSILGFDWKLTVALLASFVAKENAVSTLGILYRSGGDTLALALSSSVSVAAGLSFLVTTMLFIPCAATVATIRKETQSWRWTFFSIALLFVVAVSAGAIAFHAANLISKSLG
jgi:ferrous iron transport protein B